MTILTKDISYTYIPGNPGVVGTAGSPYIAPYCVFLPGVTNTTATNSGKTQVWIETEDNPLTSGNEAGGYFVWVDRPGGIGGGSGSSYTLPGTTICYDAVPAVPSVPYEPATPSQVTAYYNEGWNSHSRSISSLATNEIFYCTVSPGTVGGFIGIGKKGMDGRTLGSFSHGVFVDSSGVYVYESGVKVATLATSALGSAELRITRRLDNTIEYFIGIGAYTSQVDFPIADGIPAYVYAYLYSGGDSLLTAGLESGEWVMSYGSALLEATSSLSVHDISAGASLNATSSISVHDTSAGAVLDATSSLEANLSPLASLSATSALFALSTIGLASNTLLGALNGASGESAYMFQPTAYLGGMTTEIIEGNIVPATPIRFLGNLSPLVGTSALVGIQTNDCIGDIVVNAPSISASFGIYGDLEVPNATVDGTFLTVNYLNGDLNIPSANIIGTFSTTSLFEGDLDVSIPVISGVLISGTLLTGQLNVPASHVNGTIPAIEDFDGDINAPRPKVLGVIASITDDSAWAYSGENTCQP